jgi:hypothetical protein
MYNIIYPLQQNAYNDKLPLAKSSENVSALLASFVFPLVWVFPEIILSFLCFSGEEAMGGRRKV